MTAEAADEILAAIRQAIAKAIGFDAAASSVKVCGRTSIIRRGNDAK